MSFDSQHVTGQIRVTKYIFLVNPSRKDWVVVAMSLVSHAPLGWWEMAMQEDLTIQVDHHSQQHG